jgi:hypothetical protein
VNKPFDQIHKSSITLICIDLISYDIKLYNVEIFL